MTVHSAYASTMSNFASTNISGLPDPAETYNPEKNEDPVQAVKRRECRPALRKISYQKAMKKNCLLVPSPESDKPLVELLPQVEISENFQDAIRSEETENNIKPSQSNDSVPLNLARLNLLEPILSIPHIDCSNTNICRSVSFNDRLLDPQRTASVDLGEQPAFTSSGRRGSNSTPTSPLRRLMSTPGSLHIAKNFSYPSSPAESPGEIRGKKTIKNFTSTLARHLSFKKRSEGPKEGNTQLFGKETPTLEQGIQSFESLLRLFECPGCYALMSPPFPQCRKGHLVCEKCRVAYKSTCPVCKQRIVETTNYMMEQVCQLVRFPCQFFKFGCPEYHMTRQKTNHENFCVFRPVSCHFESQGCDSVLALKDMHAHVSSCPFKFKEESKEFSP